MRFELGNLAVERGRNLVSRDLRSVVRHAGHIFGALGERRDQRPLCDVSTARELDLVQCLVEQEIGCDHFLRRGALQTASLSIELSRVGLEPCQVRVRILARLHRVLLVEHARDFQECARILRHDVRRIAPRPLRIEQRHIAVGKSKTFQRELVRGAHHVDIDSGRRTQLRGIDGFQLFETTRHP